MLKECIKAAGIGVLAALAMAGCRMDMVDTDTSRTPAPTVAASASATTTASPTSARTGTGAPFTTRAATVTASPSTEGKAERAPRQDVPKAAPARTEAPVPKGSVEPQRESKQAEREQAERGSARDDLSAQELIMPEPTEDDELSELEKIDPPSQLPISEYDGSMDAGDPSDIG